MIHKVSVELVCITYSDFYMSKTTNELFESQYKENTGNRFFQVLVNIDLRSYFLAYWR